jgi:hypothetical protein
MRERYLWTPPDSEVRHYPIGSSAVRIDIADQEAQAVEEYEAAASEPAPGTGEAFVRVGIVRMGSDIPPARFQSLLEWARRQANSARRFFA